MEKIKRSALVPFSAKKMFQLVDSIENYPQFVPFCKSAETLHRDQHNVSAKLFVSKSGIAKSFSTKNTLLPYEQITMELIDGPFKKLSGVWHFKALSAEACKVELMLEYEFSNKLTSLAFAKVFNQLVQSMMTAFTEHAKTIYS